MPPLPSKLVAEAARHNGSGGEVWLGIDPGASGGLAVVITRPGLPPTVEAVPMPATERDVWEWVRSHSAAPGRPAYAVIELVGGHVGEAQPGSAMFKFGHSYGASRMALIAASIPFEAVTPQRWQRAVGVTPRKKGRRDKRARDDGGAVKLVGGESRTQFKNRLKAMAQQLFPKERVTLATADALLLAEYCRRMRRVEGASDS